MQCDVLVVGAGPAGSSAAHACAEAGLDTVFIDRKKAVGLPVSCSGAVGSYLLPFLPFKVPPSLLEYKIEGLEFVVDDLSFIRRGGPWTSYAINRPSFDKWLSEKAQSAGAQLLLETEFLDLSFDNNQVATKAFVKRGGKKEEIIFKVLIGADGVNSKVLEKLGKRSKGARIGKAVVYEYHGVNLESPTMDQVYFGDFAPGGYAHIFPVSEGGANVGVGSIDESIDIERCFEGFVSHPRVQAQLIGAKKVKEKSGVVSFDSLSESRQYGNVLFAGEAASQNIKPLVEGFFPAIICGDIAGKTASRYLLEGGALESYQMNLDRKLGPIFRESDKLIGMLEDISEIKNEKAYLLLAGLSGNIFPAEEILNLKDRDYEEIKSQLIEWTRSEARQAFLNFSERAAIFYLNLFRWLNSKIYKL
jgi:digeranylgeranylglycerophospholipid reductase